MTVVGKPLKGDFPNIANAEEDMDIVCEKSCMYF